MAILFSACVRYSVMHVFVCLLEQYDVTSIFRGLLLSYDCPSKSKANAEISLTRIVLHFFFQIN